MGLSYNASLPAHIRVWDFLKIEISGDGIDQIQRYRALSCSKKYKQPEYVPENIKKKFSGRKI